jgi:cellulose synthase/poly-beta-1,6-N-acetylglucosamine synthase-like glycosyltransferase
VIVSLALVGVVAPLLLVNLLFVAEVTAGLRRTPSFGTGKPCACTLLIPAHNEAAVLGETLTVLRGRMPREMGLVVIADNCQDDTAGIARRAGAEVLERHDNSRRGKSFALAFAAEWIKRSPSEIVLVLDADCTPEPGALERIASTVSLLDRPVQGAYLLEPQLVADPKVQVSSFAFLVKNLVRQRGARRMGGPGILTGSGMGFPRRLFQAELLASGSTVEDLELGIALTRAGSSPVFDEDALIWSKPASLRGTRTQRERWEGGFIKTALKYSLPLLWEGIRKRRWELLWLGGHLATPPLTLLLVLNFLAVAFLAAAHVTGLQAGEALTAMLGMSAATALAVAAAWVSTGRKFLPPRSLMRIPAYAFWKIALLRSVFSRRQSREWVRTERE